MLASFHSSYRLTLNKIVRKYSKLKNTTNSLRCNLGLQISQKPVCVDPDYISWRQFQFTEILCIVKQTKIHISKMSQSTKIHVAESTHAQVKCNSWTTVIEYPSFKKQTKHVRCEQILNSFTGSLVYTIGRSVWYLPLFTIK